MGEESHESAICSLSSGGIRLEMFGVAGRANRWGADAQLSAPPFTYCHTVLPARAPPLASRTLLTAGLLRGPAPLDSRAL